MFGAGIHGFELWSQVGLPDTSRSFRGLDRQTGLQYILPVPRSPK